MTLPDRDPESVVADLRSNVARLVLPAVLFVGAVGAVAFFAFRLEGLWRWVLIGGAGLVVLFGFIVPLWHWSSRRYTITTRRTILRDGMVVRRRREILHARVLEVALRRTPGQLFAGSGDVELELGGGHSATLRSIRTPVLVQAALTDLVDAQRADREYRRRSTGEQPEA